MQFTKIFSTLPLLVNLVSTAPTTLLRGLTSCPSTESSTTYPTGSRFAICPSTDLTGPSILILRNIPTLSACVRQCNTSPTCTNAVYNRSGRVCHIKGAVGELNWVENAKYDVVRKVDPLLEEEVKEEEKVAEGENISRCPVTPTASVIDGGRKRFSICPGTDLRGASAKITKGIKSADACVKMCSAIPTCVKAVWDSKGLVCHVKAPEETNTLIWVVDKRFDVISLDMTSNPAVKGKWGDLIRLPVIPVAGYVVPEFPTSSRMLVFSSWGADAFGGASGLTQFADYNFNTGAVSQRTVANTKHDMFCPGMSSLEDGRMLISGGSDAAAVSLYDPKTNTFAKGREMKIPRGYQTSVTTSEGKVFELGGSYSGKRGGKNGEIYDPETNEWTLLPGAKTDHMLTVDGEGIWRTDNHAWLYAWKNGTVFQAGPSKAQNWFDTKGTGSSTPAGTRSGGNAMCGINVMYEPGKILSAGGSQSYTNSPAVALSHITTITEPNAPSTIERIPDMTYPRGFANGVVLPDGTVLVTGGQRKSIVFTDTDGILYPELFNPATKKWTTLAPEAVPRNYHSIAILLADGTVFSGGGGLCYVGGGVGSKTDKCNKAVDHADGQIFSPPYLFNANGGLAVRPVIEKLSATSVKVGGTLTVDAKGAGKGAKLVLVRMGSVTHSTNSDQRRVPLTDVKVVGDVYTAALPGDSGVLIPGHYYLFVVSGTGVPSVARTVKVTRM